MFRRKFIKATGATMLGGALAGCSGTSSGSTETSGSGGEATNTETGTETATESGTESGTGTGTASGEFSDLDWEILDSEPPGLKVTEQNLYKESSAVGLRGTVENTGDVPYESVQVQVTLQDDQGEALWEFIDETEQEATRTLEPGAQWQFKVVFEEARMNEVSKYTVELEGDKAQTTGDEAVGDETSSGTGTSTSTSN